MEGSITTNKDNFISPTGRTRQECQVFSRVCGWLVQKDAGNPGKQAEYNDRKEYKV